MKKSKKKIEPKKIKTAREWLAEQTNTNPEDWEDILKSNKLYAKGYRYRNRKTNQFARRPTDGT